MLTWIWYRYWPFKTSQFEFKERCEKTEIQINGWINKRINEYGTNYINDTEQNKNIVCVYADSNSNSVPKHKKCDAS